MNKDLIIVGTSQQARVVIDIVLAIGEYKILGLLDSTAKIDSEKLGYQVLGRPEELNVILSKYPQAGFCVAIGDNWTRANVANVMLEQNKDINFLSLVHPRAYIAKDVELGAGCIIMAGAVVGIGSRLGKFVLVNTLASVDHDNVISDFASLGPHAATGGVVSVGEGTALCIGAKVQHNVSIGSHVVIGGASYVNADISDNCVAYGVPAKVIKSRLASDKYL